eukprot:6344736-Amphidinium_carterae.1
MARRSLVPMLQHIYNSGCPVSHGVYLLAGLQYFQPTAYRRVPRAWLCQRTWQQHTPVHARAPMPESVFLGSWMASSRSRASSWIPGHAEALRVRSIASDEHCIAARLEWQS